MTLPHKVPKSFRIIAHRGASGYAPENTLAAFRIAERIGVTEIELDIRFSKDNHLVICHDNTLDRYGHPGLRVTDLSLKELLSLDMGSWFSPFLYGGERMLTLEGLFGRFQDRFIYHVEIKVQTPEIIKALVDMIIAYRLKNRVIVTSKYYDVLTRIKKQAPFIPVGWIVKARGLTEQAIEQAGSAGFFQICPKADETNRSIVAAAHARLPKVRAYGVKRMEDAIKAIEASCDGLTINWPDWLTHEKIRSSSLRF
jgi:glycerophosphoryl diester phosphodiesterase